MKKIFLLAVLSLSFFLPLASAQGAPDIGLGSNGLAGKVAGTAGYDSGASDTALAETVGRVIKAVLSLSGIIFLALTVYAGFLWMTARGAEEQITTAKNIISAAIIGLFITLSAYAITTFVVDKLTQSTSGVEIGGVDGDILQCDSPDLPNTACVDEDSMMPNDQEVPEGTDSCPGGYICVED